MARTPTDEEMEQIFMGAGAVAMHWGRMELSLNIMIALIYHEIGGREIEPELPLMFSRRIKFLRRCFRSIAQLAPYADGAAPVFDLLGKLAPLREVVAHGGFIGVSDPQNIHFNVLRPDASKTKHRLVEHTLTLEELREIGEMARQVCFLTSHLCDRITEAFVGQNPNAYFASDL